MGWGIVTFRVAIVAPGLAVGSRGGVESVALWLYERVNEVDDFEADLISTALSSRDPWSVSVRRPRTWGRPSSCEGEAFGINLRHFGSKLAEVEFARVRPSNALTQHLAKYDLVQIVCGSPAFGQLAAGVDVPVCLQVATTFAAEREHMARRWFVRPWWALNLGILGRRERSAVSQAEHVFVENQHMLAEMLRWTLPEKVSLAPPGVDTEWFTPSRSDVVGDYILSVGRLNATRKNFAGLLEAYHVARSNHGLTARLRIVGGGDPAEVRRQVENLDLTSHVDVYPNVSEEELLSHLQGSLALALASFEEGLGLVFLEALACGKPLVATATEGAKEVFRHGDVGVLTPLFPAGLHQFAEGLASVAGSAGRWNHADLRSHAVERYGNRVAGGRFMDVYRGLLRDGQGDSNRAELL